MTDLSPEQIQNLPEELQVEVLKLLQAEKQLRQEFPLAHNKPHVPQERFHTSKKRIRLVMGSNRFGKSHAGSAEAYSNALGYYPWLVPNLRLDRSGGSVHLPAREDVPPSAWVRNSAGTPIDVPNKGLIVTGLGMRQGIGSVVWPKLQEMWPREVPIKTWMGPWGIPLRVQLPNGSTIALASKEQDRMTFEGIDLDWAWIDEPVPLYVWNGLWRGLTDRNGRVWLTQTPLGADARWVYYDLVMGERDDVELIGGSIDDNPYLDPVAKEEFKKNGSWTEQERAARVEGKFEFQSDQVFALFNREHHVVEPFAIPDDWLKGITIDPHTRRPWFIAWWAQDPQGNIFFYREWPYRDFHRMRTSDKAIPDYIDLIRSLEGKDQIMFRFLDPNYGRSPTVRHIGPRGDVKTLEDELREYGLEFFTDIQDKLEYGHAVVNDALRWDQSRPWAPDNRPQLYFFENCKNLIMAMESYCYLPYKSEQKLHEQVSEEFKDGADIVRYTMVAPKVVPKDTEGYISSDDWDELNEDDWT